MIYLVALILPPLALLLYGKVFQAIFNLLLYALAWVAFFLPPCCSVARPDSCCG